MQTTEGISSTSLSRTRRDDPGFTLIEVLIAIVVVGILAAVIIIGIGALTDTGADAACTASADAAKAAATVHYANTTPSVYPATLSAMTTTSPPELELPTGVVVAVDGLSASGGGWTLTINPGSPPSFSCS